MTTGRRVLRLSLFALLPLASVLAEPVPGAPEALFDAEGYRIDRFQAPVPDAAPGATTVTTAALRALMATASPLLIDVLPSPERPPGLPPGTLWMPPPHQSIPGSVWLPNVGYGRLSDPVAVYLRANLERLTGGDRARPLVFYCKPACWMSWNAAKRAVSLGYRAVYWYPDGFAGWAADGAPLAVVEPVPLEPVSGEARATPR